MWEGRIIAPQRTSLLFSEDLLNQPATAVFLMSRCARPGCILPGKSSFSSCLKEYYCSSSCQKTDWEIYKSMCPILKKLQNKLRPYHEVTRLIIEVVASKKGNEHRVLKYLLPFAEHQHCDDIVFHLQSINKI
jgi:hypothetical protein